VASILAANAATTPDELCVGRYEANRCVAANTVTLRRDAVFPLVVVPASTSEKAWDVVLRAGGKTVTTRVTANVMDTTECRLLASPSEVRFGLVQVSARASRSLTLRNEGSGPCVVTSWRTSDRQFRVVSLPGTGQVIPPGSELAVGLDVSLLQPRSTTATLTFELASSRPEQTKTLAVLLSVSNPADCLLATPEVLDFGRVLNGCTSSRRTITMYNVCFESVFVEAAVTEAPFRVIGGLAEDGVWLAPGHPVTVTVQFEPSSSTAAQVTGALRVTGGVRQIVALSGRTDPRPLQTDRFGEEPRGSVDLVLVLDDSPSFARQHAHTRAQLDALGRFLTMARERVNSRVAVTTTDVSSTGPQGRFRATDAGQRWAAGDDLTFIETFTALSQLTTTGAERQSCIEAAARAVTGPLAADAGPNGGFRRPRVPLTMICVTDDLDNAANPELWRSALQGLDAGSQLKYSVFGPIGSTCPVDALDVAGSHLTNVRAFHGEAGDICGPWPSYPGTGWGWTRRRTFYLTGTPVFGSVRVTIDGVDVPETSNGRMNWTYDPASNAVTFSPSTIGLDPPMLIEISYPSGCWP